MSGSVITLLNNDALIFNNDVLNVLNPSVINSLASSSSDIYFEPASSANHDAICFDESTEILCLNGKFQEVYIPVNKLIKGTLVKTYKHGFRRIDCIFKGQFVNNKDNFRNCMFVLPKNKNMTKDLIVTGGHSILVDDLGEYKEENKKLFAFETPKIDNKYLLLSSVSKDFIKMENNDTYTYYHLVLENEGDNELRFGVWANGVLTETPSKKFVTETLLGI